MRAPRRSVTLFLALVTTLLAEFFLLVWRVQERPVLAVAAAVLFAVAAVLWVFAIRRLRRDRLR
jgi:membrane protein YdbS with pleckstrin-like domain